MKKVMWYLMITVLMAGLWLGCAKAPTPEQAKGELIIDYIGGPEVIASREQYEAARVGVVDMAFTPTQHYISLVPEANILPISHLMPWEEREVGIHDLMVEVHKKINLYYLGRTIFGEPWTSFFFWTNVRVETPYDLAGQKFRALSLYLPFMQELGISPVTMSLGDIYTAMDRGLVDGWAATPGTGLRFHLDEVTKYVIAHGFYQSNATVKMNLDTWNSLPKHLQDLMIKVQIEAERAE